ncbi:hypothetical protein J6590_035525, partial [Homalodisca vitripennis]
ADLPVLWAPNSASSIWMCLWLKYHFFGTYYFSRSGASTMTYFSSSVCHLRIRMPLIEKVNFKVPSGIRSRDLFTRVEVSPNYMTNSLMLRIQKHGTTILDDIDLLRYNGFSFKRFLLGFQRAHW